MLRVHTRPVAGSVPVTRNAKISLNCVQTYSGYSSEPNKYLTDIWVPKLTKSKSSAEHVRTFSPEKRYNTVSIYPPAFISLFVLLLGPTATFTLPVVSTIPLSIESPGKLFLWNVPILSYDIASVTPLCRTLYKCTPSPTI